jgi:hypothetical protein
MIGAVKRVIDRIRGYGDADVTVPVLDGRLKPNQRLDHSEIIATLEAPDQLVVSGERLLCSSGNRVMELLHGADRRQARLVYEASSTITAIAAMPDGGLAVAAQGEGISFVGGGLDGRKLAGERGPNPSCITDLLFFRDNHLVIAEGSKHYSMSQWKRDLMSRSASGGVWLADLASFQVRELAGNLAFPYGLAAYSKEQVLVSESWNHRVLSFEVHLPFAPQIMVPELPAYPSRIAAAPEGGYWLSLFAPRNEIIEFVLRQPQFRRRMIEEVPEEFWVAPALSSGKSFLEPLQGGGVKQMGMLKPWAPTLTYGLVARFDERGAIIESLHSRADGQRHGTTSALSFGGDLFVASKGSGSVLMANSRQGGAKA